MTTVRVKLKGRDALLYGPMWTWRPKEGWFSIISEHEDPNTDEIKIYLRDVESAVDQQVMVRKGVIEDVDLLVRARDDGWDGT